MTIPPAILPVGLATHPPGHSDVLVRLAEDHWPQVVRFLFGMVGDLALAEDLAQDTFVRAAERLPQLREAESGAGWLFTIAANVARQHLRRARRWRWLPWRDESLRGLAAPSPTAGPERAVTAVLGRLPADDREMLILVGVLGLTATEAAPVAGISVAAAHKRWQRACRRLRQALAEEDRDAL